MDIKEARESFAKFCKETPRTSSYASDPAYQAYLEAKAASQAREAEFEAKRIAEAEQEKKRVSALLNRYEEELYVSPHTVGCHPMVPPKGPGTYVALFSPYKVKIGRSENIALRFQDFVTTAVYGMPPLLVYTSKPEGELHHQFDALCDKSLPGQEFFWLHSELLSYINELRSTEHQLGPVSLSPLRNRFMPVPPPEKLWGPLPKPRKPKDFPDEWGRRIAALPKPFSDRVWRYFATKRFKSARQEQFFELILDWLKGSSFKCPIDNWSVAFSPGYWRQYQAEWDRYQRAPVISLAGYGYVLEQVREDGSLPDRNQRS